MLTAALYPSVAGSVHPPAIPSAQRCLRERKAWQYTHRRLRSSTSSYGFVSILSSLIWCVLDIWLLVLQNARVDARELKGYMVFLEKVKTSAVFLRDSTAISHYPLLLFGGSHLRIDHTKGMQKISIVESDGKYAFTVDLALNPCYVDYF